MSKADFSTSTASKSRRAVVRGGPGVKLGKRAFWVEAKEHWLLCDPDQTLEHGCWLVVGSSKHFFCYGKLATKRPKTAKSFRLEEHPPEGIANNFKREHIARVVGSLTPAERLILVARPGVCPSQ